MNEEDSQFPNVKSRQRIECKVIWGGIQNIDAEVTAGKFVGSIYSSASEGEQGGDIYFFGVCREVDVSALTSTSLESAELTLLLGWL